MEVGVIVAAFNNDLWDLHTVGEVVKESEHKRKAEHQEEVEKNSEVELEEADD